MHVFLLACLFAVGPPTGPVEEDLALLREHRVGTDGPSLLAFLRKRYGGATDEQIRKLIEQLGDDSFDTRESASQELITLGVRARPFLKKALSHADLEIRYRAERCLLEVEKRGGVTLQVTAAAIRQVGRLRPAGAVALLLESVGSAEDEPTAAEMRVALGQVGVRNGKADPLLVKALTDRSVPKRLAAALALVHCEAQLPNVRKRLKDDDLAIRLHVGLALLQRGERDALKVLAEAMAEKPTRETAVAEDMLFRLAGERSPTLSADTVAARRTYRDAWLAWAKEHGPKADLAILKEHARLAGFTTIVLLDKNEVLDLDASNRVRWRITGLETPLDVQRLSGERVLLAEHAGNRVTERDSKGKVVWQFKVEAPLMAQRLSNGNTFITTKARLIEVDKKGNEVSSYTRPLNDHFMRARRLPGGDTIMITQLGVSRFVRIDRFGKEVSSFGVEVYTSGGRIDMTTAGNVLIPELHNNRIVERSMDGKLVREIAVQQPITAFTLPNGHIIITSMLQKRAFEVGRSGKEVWEYKRNTRVTRAVRY
jgi:HEAT repeat protein